MCISGGADVDSLPFVSGAISGATGIQSLQPFILALLAVLIILVGAYMPGFGAIIPVSVCERAVVNDELNNVNSRGSRVVKMWTVSLDVFIAGLL